MLFILGNRCTGREREMGRRKGRKASDETLISTHENEEEGKGGRFFSCYLLTSLCPRFKGHTYIGFTVNPRRRIRQHNGEIGCGAWRTKRKRPWEMVLCIYGFPTNVAALQFEWAWQHPVESLAVRAAAASFKSLSGLANKIKLAHTMLTLPSWQSLNLTVNFFSTKYQQHMRGCLPLPEQMRIQVCSMDELPCYNMDALVNDDDDDEVSTREESTEEIRQVQNPSNHGSPQVNFHGKNYQINDDSTVYRENLAKPCSEWPGNSSPEREPIQGRSFTINDSPARTTSSFIGSYIFEDLQTSTSAAQVTVEFDHTLKQSRNALVADRDLLINSPDLTNHNIEIIDIFTPSPCCYTVKSGSKKRRPTLYPEIIDLTNSPMFV